MAHTTKIATCCYCGTRAALVLGKSRHELACSTCGAPLHDLKRLTCDTTGKRERARPSAVRKFPTGQQRKSRAKRKSGKKDKKKRKGFMMHLFEEVLDAVEDVLD